MLERLDVHITSSAACLHPYVAGVVVYHDRWSRGNCEVARFCYGARVASEIVSDYSKERTYSTSERHYQNHCQYDP